jgi:hypothetical protein
VGVIKKSGLYRYAPAKASGVGIIKPGGPNGAGPNSPQPWSTKWFGQLGRDSYFNTFKVPFQRSVRLTYQCPPTICHNETDSVFLFIQVSGSNILAPSRRLRDCASEDPLIFVQRLNRW